MSDTKCPLLWNHFCVHTTNVVTPCCRTDHADARKNNGYWHQSKISDGIHSIHHIESRQMMREGKRPVACNICYYDEDKGLSSARQMLLQNPKYQNIDYSTEPTYVEELDIKFNNTCNLGCRMCSPGSSSLVNSMLNKVNISDRLHGNMTVNHNTFNEDEKLEMAKHLIANGLKNLKATGGEPFVQTHFLELIDWCIEHGYNKNLTLDVTTNLTLFDQETFDKFLTFKKVTFVVSLDGHGDTYDYIRYKGDWKTLEKNLDIIGATEIDNFQWRVSCVLQLYNVFNIKDLSLFLFKKQYKNFSHFVVDVYIKPYEKSELNVKNLPDNLLEQVYMPTDKPKKYIANLIGKDKDIKMLKEFARKTVIYDKLRNQSYKVLDHRIVNLIEGYL